MPLNTASLTAERIIDAASKLFAANGYHATSTRNIARFADISENTLFRHFRCKEDVFWAALRGASVEDEMYLQALRKLEYGEPPEEALPTLFVLFDKMVNARPEFTRLWLIGLLELRMKPDEFLHENLQPIVHALNSYMGRSVQSGYVRDLNPGLATTALMSTALLYPAFLKLMGDEGVVKTQRGEGSREFANFWLDLWKPSEGYTDWHAPRCPRGSVAVRVSRNERPEQWKGADDDLGEIVSGTGERPRRAAHLSDASGRTTS